MEKVITYSEIRGNQIVVCQDEYDYEVRLNDMVICSTGDSIEAEMIAESLNIALTILDYQGALK
jgi:hypothetical protein